MKDILSEEMPWPQMGDKLFASDSDWWYNACLNSCFSDKWESYAQGYKDAADILMDQVIGTRLGMDFLVFPIVFVYRHYMELRLKELIIHGRQLLDLDPPDVSKWTHDIKFLWKDCRQILELVWPEGSKTDLDTVGACIDEFCRFDKMSMSFRYPVTRDGKPSITNLQSINLRNLRDVMNRLSGLLEGSSAGICAYMDYKSDSY